MTLQEYMDARKLKPEGLAEILGFSRSYTVQLLNGTRGASKKTALQIQAKTRGKVRAVTIMGLV